MMLMHLSLWPALLHYSMSTTRIPSLPSLNSFRSFDNAKFYSTLQKNKGFGSLHHLRDGHGSWLLETFFFFFF
jgi:hypothetical protein